MSEKSSAPPKKPFIRYVTDPVLEKPYPIVFNSNQKKFDSAVNLKLESDDVIVASFPKCGTTWTMYALYLLRENGVLPPDNLEDAIPFLEWDGAEPVEDVKERPRIIKTHLYWEITPKHEHAKYIFVARNPKDCVVSFYHHTTGFEGYEFRDGTFDDYFESFIKGDVDSGDYFQCVGRWFEESKTNKNVLFVLYEDMKDNFERKLKDIAYFLGPAWEDKLFVNNNELLDKILHETSFASMHKRSKQICTTDRPDDKPFVRKGIVGDWKNMLNADQNRRIENRIKETAKQFKGFDRIWEKYESVLTF